MGIVLPQLAPASEDRVSGALVIDRSLKFNGQSGGNHNYGHLRRTSSGASGAGTFTISWWAKRGSFRGDWQYMIAGDNGSLWGVGFAGSSGTLDAITLFNGSSHQYSSAKFRDNAGWYHIVLSVDSISGSKLWVNGVAQSNTNTNTSYNLNNTMYIGKWVDSGTAHNYDGNLAQYTCIDGLQLGPSYFGYADPLTGTWRPKKFSAGGTTVNDGTEWTTKMSNTSLIYVGSASNVFNGNALPWNTSNYASYNSGVLTLLTGVNIEVKGSIRIFGNWGYGDYIVINGVNYLNDGDGTNRWITPTGVTYPFTLSSLALDSTPLGYQNSVSAVEIDGVIMKDNTTQNLAFGSAGFYLPLDGNSPLGEDKSGNGNDWKVQGFGFNDIEEATGARPVLNTANGGNVAAPGAFGSQVSRDFTILGTSGGGLYRFEGISGTNPPLSFVRGATYIFDYSATSGNHPLAFSTTDPDSSTTSYTDGVSTATSNVTKITVPHDAPDTLYYYCTSHSNMNNAITVTTDETKADPYAWKCTLACPLAGNFADVSNKLNCTLSAAKATSASGNVHSSSDKSVFYNSSHEFDGTGDYITATDSSDFAFGTGDFTAEAWFNPDDIADYRTVLDARSTGASSATGWIIGVRATAKIYVYSNGFILESQTPVVVGVWTHVAFVRSGSTETLYVNGVAEATRTSSSNYTDQKLRIGGEGYTGGGASFAWNGYITDIRMYKGAAKYTSNFIPASTSPDLVPMVPSGVSNRSKLHEITDGGVNFEGDNYLKTATSSSDFTFGTGDFTIEMFLYSRETGGRGFIQFSDSSGGLKNTSSGVVTIHKDAGENGVFRAYAKNTSTAFSTMVPYKQWCHVALVRDSGTIKLFVDGKQDATTISSDTTDYATTYAAIGGYYDTGYLSDCIISNVRVNKGTALYTSDFIPPTKALTNVTNTTLLCCNSPTSTTAATVTPVNIGSNYMPAGYTYWDAGYTAGFSYSGRVRSVATRSDFIPVALPSTGKYYWEIKVDNVGTYHVFGVTDDGGNRPGTDGYNDNNTGFYYNGNPPLFMAKKANGTSTVDQAGHGAGSGVNFVNGDIIMWAYDADNAKMWVGRNGTWYHGDPGAGTNASFQNMPTSGAYFKTSYSTTGSGTMTFEILSRPSGPLETGFNPFNTINAVRGQETSYCTLSNLTPGFAGTLSDGGLYYNLGSGTRRAEGTVSFTSGKYYWEATAITGTTNGSVGGRFAFCVQADETSQINPEYIDNIAWHATAGIQRFSQGSATSLATGVNYGDGDTVALAIDADAYIAYFYKNGVLAYTIPFNRYIPAGSNLTAHVWNGSSGTPQWAYNFGQKPFKYTPPAGFKILSGSEFRSDDTLARSDKFVSVVTYRGDGNERKFGGSSPSANATVVGGTLTDASNAFNGSGANWATLTATDTSTAAHVDFEVYLTGITRIEAAFDSPSGSGDTRGRYNGANAGNTRTGTGSGYSDIFNGYATTITSVGFGINQNGTTGTSSDIVSRFRITDSQGTRFILDRTGDDLNFTPDLSWFSIRNDTGYIKYLFDSVRGATKYLATSHTQTSDAQGTAAQTLKAFDSDGVTIGSNGQMNQDAKNYVSWNWKAGGGKAGGGGFFKDDVEYANAAALNMDVGNLNSVAYNSSKVWSNNINATNNPTNAFDGNTGTYAQNPNNTMVSQIVLSDIGGLSGRVRVWVGTSGGNRYMFNVNNGPSVTTATSWGGGWVDVGVASNIHSITTTRINGSDTLPTNECMIYAYEIDGKMLLDTGVSAPTNIPSIAASACSVGTKQGFSIVQYTGVDNGTAATVPHGLTQKPDFMLVKGMTDGSRPWIIYHSALGATKYFQFDNTNAGTNSGPWNDTEPTSTHFTLGTSYNNVNVSGGKSYISYHWHNVPGFQKFGKYSGNSSNNGSFVELGFRPAIVIIRLVGNDSWRIYDNKRGPINPNDVRLLPNSNVAENNSIGIDFLSNGFKLRDTDGAGNATGSTYVYAAWAEAPEYNLFGAFANAR